MDLLQKELQRKRQALEKAKKQVGGDGGRKYMKNGDVRRVQEKEEEERQQRALAGKRSRETETEISRIDYNDSSSLKKKKKKKHEKNSMDKTDSKKNLIASSSKDFDYSSAHVTKTLRDLGLPIRFFGETHQQRTDRLQEALEKQTNVLAGLSEKEEFRLGKGHGIRNPFLGRGEEEEKEKRQPKKKKHREEESNGNKGKEEEESEGNDADDPTKQIYKYLKGLLKEWEQDLTERPDIVARSVAGRNESKTFKQCKDYIRPLFKLCKTRKLEPGLEAHLIKIVNFSKVGEFVKAHDAYMDVAIGRAAWPIGVTMVGIHARSGRAKIESSKVAHVMNSELQRKYLTSVKRLLSYAQKKRPDVDPSKKVA